jgi:hypothetical protein
VKVSRAVDDDAGVTVVVVGVGIAGVVITGAATAAVFPTSQVCSALKLGGEQGALLRKPSRLRVKHWFPGPTPLLTAFRTRGKPILPERLEVELKKNC